MGSGFNVYFTATQLSRISFMSTYRASHRSKTVAKSPMFGNTGQEYMLHHVNNN
jgi:hypothetical protein